MNSSTNSPQYRHSAADAESPKHKRLRSRTCTSHAIRAFVVASVLGVAQGTLMHSPAVLAQSEVPAIAEAAQTPGVNINTASAAEIAEALSGVGGSKADAIVRYREQFGPFESVEELTEVQGIGDATLLRNRALLRIE